MILCDYNWSVWSGLMRNISNSRQLNKREIHDKNDENSYRCSVAQNVHYWGHNGTYVVLF